MEVTNSLNSTNFIYASLPSSETIAKTVAFVSLTLSIVSALFIANQYYSFLSPPMHAFPMNTFIGVCAGSFVTFCISCAYVVLKKKPSEVETQEPKEQSVDEEVEEIPSTQHYHPPVTKIAPPDPTDVLPLELWTYCFSFLVNDIALISLRSVCKKFEQLTESSLLSAERNMTFAYFACQRANKVSCYMQMHFCQLSLGWTHWAELTAIEMKEDRQKTLVRILRYETKEGVFNPHSKTLSELKRENIDSFNLYQFAIHSFENGNDSQALAFLTLPSTNSSKTDIECVAENISKSLLADIQKQDLIASLGAILLKRKQYQDALATLNHSPLFTSFLMIKTYCQVILKNRKHNQQFIVKGTIGFLKGCCERLPINQDRIDNFCEIAQLEYALGEKVSVQKTLNTTLTSIQSDTNINIAAKITLAQPVFMALKKLGWEEDVETKQKQLRQHLQNVTGIEKPEGYIALAKLQLDIGYQDLAQFSLDSAIAEMLPSTIVDDFSLYYELLSLQATISIDKLFKVTEELKQSKQYPRILSIISKYYIDKGMYEYAKDNILLPWLKENPLKEGRYDVSRGIIRDLIAIAIYEENTQRPKEAREILSLIPDSEYRILGFLALASKINPLVDSNFGIEA